jgi:nucleotide-binding universal stress UspA family protein
MSLPKKILAPTDFSDLSADGVRYGCQLARDAGAELLILNVVLLDETNTMNKSEMERHKLRLDEFIAEKIGDTASHVRIKKLVDAGQPYGAILDCADNERVDLIVMCSHGRSGLSRALIGSVTDKLLRAASCPVLVVPAQKGN